MSDFSGLIPLVGNTRNVELGIDRELGIDNSQESNAEIMQDDDLIIVEQKPCAVIRISDSPLVENDNDGLCDLPIQNIKSECENSEKKVFNTCGEGNSHTTTMINDDNRIHGCNGCENCNDLISTSVRNERNELQQMYDFFRIPVHRRWQDLPAVRLLDVVSGLKSPTPNHKRIKLASTIPKPVESQSTQMDLFQSKSYHSEALARADESELHLWTNPISPDGGNIISEIRNFQERTRRKRCNVRANEDSSKTYKLYTSNASRYELDFVDLEQIGSGHFGHVYKCLNLMNRLIYAVKISKDQVMPFCSENNLSHVKKELYAHGVLEHINIVRNYSSWAENGYTYIQNEYCNKGNLESYMRDHPVVGKKAKKLLYDVASALRYMHNLRLVHLAVEPENIFVHQVQGEIDDGSDLSSDEFPSIIFKLGDLGHIIHLDKPFCSAHRDESCNLRATSKYAALEILLKRRTDLRKADIFSLALSVYAAAGVRDGIEIEHTGREWYLLRKGILRKLRGLSSEVTFLLKSMVRPDLTRRPSAAEICSKLVPTRSELIEKLEVKKQKIADLRAKQWYNKYNE